MSTVSQIANALKARLETLPGVDQASTDSYLPPVETDDIALVIPPLGQETQVWTQTARRTPLFQSHRIRCEFWVKLVTGNLPLTLQRTREIGLMAIRDLLAEPTLNGTVQSIGHFGPGSNQVSITCDVADVPVQIAGVPYLVATVLVPLTDYADPDAYA